MLGNSRDDGVWEVLVTGAHRIVSGHQGKSTHNLSTLKANSKELDSLCHT